MFFKENDCSLLSCFMLTFSLLLHGVSQLLHNSCWEGVLVGGVYGGLF